MQLRISILYVSAALVSGASACDTSGIEQESSIRDSAGVQIVEHYGRASSGVEHWSLSITPLVEIGATEEDDAYLFTRVVTAARLDTDELVVAEFTTNDLRVFDSTGQLVRRIGRRGRGPGEFQQLSWVGVTPTGFIGVHDGTIRRLTRFSSGGELLGIADLPSPPESRGTTGLVIGQFGDGSLLRRWFVSMPDMPNPGLEMVRDSIGLYVVTQDGSAYRPVGRFPGREDIRVVGRVIMQRPAPFGLETVIAVADSTYYVGTQESYEIRAFRKTGELFRILRRRESPQPVTADLRATWQRIRDQEVARMESSPRPAEVLEAARYNIMPRTLPAYGLIRVDRAGNLWVQDYLPFPEQDSVSTWAVYGPDGALRATATLPNLQITEIGHEHVVLIWRDEDLVPFVRVHALTKGTTAASF